MNIKLKGAPAIYLVGFMGCGKSSVGRLLADRLGWVFADLDEEIEESWGMRIAEIFELEGEARFREMEQAALAGHLKLARHGHARVLALGGGAFANPAIRQLIGEDGVSIWLDSPMETLWQRVAGEPNRPLARNRDEFSRLYDERLPLYRGADFTVVCGDDEPEQVVEKILQLHLLK